MHGFAWFQERIHREPDGNYSKRYLVVRPFAGLQYFSQEPLELDTYHVTSGIKDLENSINIGNRRGWIFGGSVSVQKITPEPELRFREFLLYPMRLEIRASLATHHVILSLEDAQLRDKWIAAICELKDELLYVKNSISFDTLPFLHLLRSRDNLHLISMFVNSNVLRSIAQVCQDLQWSSLKSIVLRNCGLNDHHALLIKKLLTINSTTLQELSLAENLLSFKGIKPLASSLRSCTSLVAVDLSNNAIDDEALESLCATFECMNELTVLNLSRNRLTELSAGLLGRKVLNYRSKIQHLDLSCNQLGDALGPVICTLLQCYPSTLIKGNFAYCGLTDQSARNISQHITSCSTLQILSLDGTFLQPTTMRLLMTGTMKHFEVHQRNDKEGLSVRYGGVLRSSQSCTALSSKALKLALAELSEGSLIEQLRIVSRHDRSNMCMVICLRVQLPSFIMRVEDVLIQIAEEIGCRAEQLPLLTVTDKMQDDYCFIMFGVGNPYAEESLEDGKITQQALELRLGGMAKESHPLLRMLGVRSAYIEYSRRDDKTGELHVVCENIAINQVGFWSKGLRSEAMPPLGDLNVYAHYSGKGQDFKYEDWTEVKDIEDAEKLQHNESKHLDLSHKEASEHSDHHEESLSNSYIVQDTATRQKLILAVRTLYSSKEITSSAARFWEGALGNRNCRAYAESELIQAMKIDWINTSSDSVTTVKVAEKLSDLNSEEIKLLSSIVETSLVNLHIYPAIAERQLLYDAMFSRDTFRIQTLLKLFNNHTGGHAASLGQKLLNDIVALQKTWVNVKGAVNKFADLRLVEEFLLNCGRIGYSGPEMFQAVDLRQIIVSQAIEKKDKKAAEELNKIKFRALMSNLLISRDMAGLRTHMNRLNGNDNGNEHQEFSSLPEFLVADSILQQFDQNEKKIRKAIDQRSIDELDNALSSAAYSYFYYTEIDRAVGILNEISRNPATLLRRIVDGLRNDMMSEVDKGFEDLNKMGLSHQALDAVICSKIFAIKKRNNQVVSRADTKKAHATKQEQLITDLLARNDVVMLNKLFCGRGMGKLVMSFPTAFARDEWYEKLKVACAGKHNESNLSSKEVVITGIFEKAARSVVGTYRGWRKRYFILYPSHIAYFVRPGGEQKGFMRTVGGAVRIMDPNEFALAVNRKGSESYSNRLYCLELEEGKDISTINPRLFAEVKKVVRMAKIAKLEQLLHQAIKLKSPNALQKLLNYAKDLDVLLDFKLTSDAKKCMQEFNLKDIVKELYMARRNVPQRHILKALLQRAEESDIDMNLPSLQFISNVALLEDVKLSILRASLHLDRGDRVSFAKDMRKLCRLNWSQISMQDSKAAFIRVFAKFVVAIVREWLWQGRNRQEVHKVLRRALLLCSGYHMETESMDLMRLALNFPSEVQLKDIDATDPALERPNANSLVAYKDNAGDISVEDMQSFIEELNASVLLPKSHYSLHKYPYLRDDIIVATKKSTLQMLGMDSSTRSSKLNNGALTFSAEDLKMSLLVLDKASALNDSSICAELFSIIQVIMQDKPVSSLPKQSKSKIAKSERSEINLVADLLRFVHNGNSTSITDEVYFQICKQVNLNFSARSRNRGWLLFTTLVHCVAPSPSASPYIKAFVEDQILKLTLLLEDEESTLEKHVEQSGESKYSQGGADESSSLDDPYYSLRAAKYASFLLNNRTVEENKSRSEGNLNPSDELFVPYLEAIWSQQPIDVQIVLMTGHLITIRLPFSQLCSPSTILLAIYETIMPRELRTYYLNHRHQISASNEDNVDRQIMNEYDILFDINYRDEENNNVRRSAKISGNKHDENVTVLEALRFFQGYALFRVDDSDLNIDMQKIPVQPSEFVSWHRDVQFEVLTCFVKSLVPNPHHIIALDSKSGRAFALRNILMSPSFNQFSSDFELLGMEFAPYESHNRMQSLKQWLAGDTLKYSVPSNENGEAKPLVARLDQSHSLVNAQSGIVLPFDFTQVDLLFAEETRYVNSRLALLADEHFHYLLSIQLAITWSDKYFQQTASGQVSNSLAGTSSCYFSLPLKDIARANALHDSRVNMIRESMKMSSGIVDAKESESEPDTDDVEEQEDIDALKHKFELMRTKNSKYSPQRSIFKKVSDQDHSSINDRDGEQRESDDDDSSRGDDYVSARGVWSASPIISDQPITAEDLQHLLTILGTLGVQVADPSQGEKDVQGRARIDILWQNMAQFHSVAREGGSGLESPRYRYLMKRAYLDYLTAVTGYNGMHFIEATLTSLFLEDNLKYESSSLTSFVESFTSPLPFLFAISLYGIYLCDVDSWAVVFHSPLCDLQHYELLQVSKQVKRKGSDKSQALCKLFINGLQLSLMGSERDMTSILTILEQCVYNSVDVVERNVLDSLTVSKETNSAVHADSSRFYLAAYSNVYKALALESPAAAHQHMLQQFVQKYCPLLPNPRTTDALPLSLSSKVSFKPLLNNRQVIVQQRLESLQRDQALSALATQARYEKSQEHMHKQSSQLNKMGMEDEDEEGEDDDDSVGKAEDKAAEGGSIQRKNRAARSIFGDPARNKIGAAQLQGERVLSSLVGIACHQGHRFRSQVQASSSPQHFHGGSLYLSGQNSGLSKALEGVPVRIQGLVQTSSGRAERDSVQRLRNKPRFSPLLSGAVLIPQNVTSHFQDPANRSGSFLTNASVSWDIKQLDVGVQSFYQKHAQVYCDTLLNSSVDVEE